MRTVNDVLRDLPVPCAVHRVPEPSKPELITGVLKPLVVLSLGRVGHSECEAVRRVRGKTAGEQPLRQL